MQFRTIFRGGSFKYQPCREDTFELVTYESNLPYALRFMIDNSVVGMSWIKVRAGAYRMRPVQDKLCNTQYEIDVEDFNANECQPCVGDFATIAPPRIPAFDI